MLRFVADMGHNNPSSSECSFSREEEASSENELISCAEV